jgi:hypothetical protein
LDGLGALDPGVFHHNHGIAHPGNQVNKEIVAVSFEEPYRIANFTVKAFGLQKLQSFGCVLRGQKKIEIFRVARDSGVLTERERTRNCERHLLLF